MAVAHLEVVRDGTTHRPAPYDYAEHLRQQAREFRRKRERRRALQVWRAQMILITTAVLFGFLTWWAGLLPSRSWAIADSVLIFLAWVAPAVIGAWAWRRTVQPPRPSRNSLPIALAIDARKDSA
jgi:hypothetical protein